MSGLWQISFAVPGQAEIFAEMTEAGADAEATTIYHDEAGERWLISLITAAEPDRGRLAAALEAAASITGHAADEPEIQHLPARDWLGENRKAFPPLLIGSFWIYGSHVTDPVPDGKIDLRLDAGQAFGSGTHGTTHGCITMMEKHLPGGSALHIADIGCGSGILAMAAAKLRPQATVIAVDNDPVAVKVARENAEDNAVGGIIQTGISEGYAAALVRDAAPYDLILANILPAPLIDMAGEAAACLAEHGVLIVSGLLEDQQEQVISAHQKHGLSLKDSMIFNGWATLVLSHG